MYPNDFRYSQAFFFSFLLYEVDISYQASLLKYVGYYWKDFCELSDVHVPQKMK